MHTNEQYGGWRLCVSEETDTHCQLRHRQSWHARARATSEFKAMLSDTHHLGTCITAGAPPGHALPGALEAIMPHFSAIFRSDNCVSRSLSTAAELIQALMVHYNTTLYSLSSDAYQTVSSRYFPGLDQLSINRSPSLRQRETRLNSCAYKRRKCILSTDTIVGSRAYCCAALERSRPP